MPISLLLEIVRSAFSSSDSAASGVDQSSTACALLPPRIHSNPAPPGVCFCVTWRVSYDES